MTKEVKQRNSKEKKQELPFFHVGFDHIHSTTNTNPSTLAIIEMSITFSVQTFTNTNKTDGTWMDFLENVVFSVEWIHFCYWIEIETRKILKFIKLITPTIFRSTLSFFFIPLNLNILNKYCTIAEILSMKQTVYKAVVVRLLPETNMYFSINSRLKPKGRSVKKNHWLFCRTSCKEKNWSICN